MKKFKRLCKCDKVNKIHYVEAHKAAATLVAMQKTPEYKVGYLHGLRSAQGAISNLEMDAESKR